MRYVQLCKGFISILSTKQYLVILMIFNSRFSTVCGLNFLIKPSLSNDYGKLAIIRVFVKQSI